MTKEETMALFGDFKITDEILILILNRDDICWHESVIPGYIRIHFDRERYMSKCQDYPIHELVDLMFEWITNYENSPEMLCSHKLFYITTDGSDWYCGYAHSKTTYNDDQTVNDISKGKTRGDALVNAIQHILDNKDKK